MSLGAESLFGAPLVMLFFGLGTLPMMLTLSISGNFFGSLFSSKGARRIAGILVLIMTIFYMGSMIMSDLGKGGHGGHGAGDNHGSMEHSSMNHGEMDHDAIDHSAHDRDKVHEKAHEKEHDVTQH